MAASGTSHVRTWTVTQGITRAAPGTSEEARFTAILAYLRDPRLLTRLGTRAKDGRLAKYEHRALIHLNSDEATAVYLASRRHYFDALDAIDPMVDKTNAQRAALWYDLVPKQGDIVRSPHDALVRLAKQELKRADWADVGFGLELADTLQHPDLVDEYADAVAGRRRKAFVGANDMIPRLVAGMAPSSVVKLYNAVTSVAARKAILRAAGDVPGDQVEQLLLEALNDGELFNSACIGLTTLRSMRAGPELHQRLQNVGQSSRRLVVKALGRIRYEPALGDLIALLGKLSTAPGENDPDTANAEYELVTAVGAIGGALAYDSLASRWSSKNGERILSLLLDSHDAYAISKVHGILKANPAAKHLLGPALAHRELLHDDVFYFRDESSLPEFDDEVVLDALLESARDHLREGSVARGGLSLWQDHQAIALFASPRAREFLEDLAGRDPEHERADLNGAIRFARNLLGHRGDRHWAKAAIEEELDVVSRREWFVPRDEDRLRQWPRDIVREVLLEMIRRNPARMGTYLYLLVPVAMKDDEEVIRANLDKVNPDLADVIKQRLPAR